MLKKLRIIVAPILTVILYVVVCLVLSNTLDFSYKGSAYFWVLMIGSFGIMLFTTLVWAPNGTILAEKTPEVYNTTLLYNNRVNYIVINQLKPALRAFCKRKTTEAKLERIINELDNAGCILDDYKQYQEVRMNIQFTQYKKWYKNKIKLERLKNAKKPVDDSDKLQDNDSKKYQALFDVRARRDKRALKLFEKIYRGKIQVKALQDTHITSSHSTKQNIVPINKETRYKGIFVLFKIVWAITLTLFMVFVSFGDKEFGSEELIQLLIWAVTIGTNIVSSIFASYHAVFVLRREYINEKSDYCVEFLGEQNINVQNDVDQAVESLLKTQN